MTRVKSGKGSGRAAATVATAGALALHCMGAGAAEDLIGRPVDLDLSRGVQAPPRDASKLPTTFAEAAKTQPVEAKWGTAPYHPKSRRDLSGLWINQGGIGWTPGIPPGPRQNPPLNEKYAAIFQQNIAN